MALNFYEIKEGDLVQITRLPNNGGHISHIDAIGTVTSKNPNGTVNIKVDGYGLLQNVAIGYLSSPYRGVGSGGGFDFGSGGGAGEELPDNYNPSDFGPDVVPGGGGGAAYRPEEGEYINPKNYKMIGLRIKLKNLAKQQYNGLTGTITGVESSTRYNVYIDKLDTTIDIDEYNLDIQEPPPIWNPDGPQTSTRSTRTDPDRWDTSSPRPSTVWPPNPDTWLPPSPWDIPTPPPRRFDSDPWGRSPWGRSPPAAPPRPPPAAPPKPPPASAPASAPEAAPRWTKQGTITDPKKCPAKDSEPVQCVTLKDFRRQSGQFHPDRNTGCIELATEKMQHLNTLCDHLKPIVEVGEGGKRKTKINKKKNRKSRRK